MAMNTSSELIRSVIESRLGHAIRSVIVPLAEIAAIFLTAYFILLAARAILVRLQRREVFTAAAVEHIHRLLALIVYTIAFASSLYIVTNIHEIIYFFMLIIIIILGANWRVLASATAYYIMLLRREAYRATLIDFPRLGIRGKIVNTSLLYTKLRTPSGRIVYIPNYITINEPVMHLVNIQTTIRLEVRLDIPNDISSTTYVQELEKRLQQRLDNEHLVTRAKDVVLRLVAIENRRAVLILEVPVAGYEPRPSTLNQILAVMQDELKDYKPEIRLLEQI